MVAFGRQEGHLRVDKFFGQIFQNLLEPQIWDFKASLAIFFEIYKK